MADYIDHLHQAEHNENFARSLINGNSEFYDWSITAIFYSAVHYVEAVFNQDPKIRHTETSCRGKDPHVFREEMVLQKYGKACRNHYRKLRTASQIVRYLVVNDPRSGVDFYRPEDAANFLNTNLQAIKKTLGL